MISRIASLIETSQEAFEGNPWFGHSLLTKLKSIDYSYVNEKPLNSNNSIAMIVQHVINWRIFTLEKLAGDPSYDIEINSDEDWPAITIHDQREWDNLLKNLVATQSKLIEVLNESKDDSFLSNATPGRDYNVEYLLNGIIQHDIYHAGQIGLLYSQVVPNE